MTWIPARPLTFRSPLRSDANAGRVALVTGGGTGIGRATALERFGHVDVVVNNAGGQFSAPAEEISADGWRAVERVSVAAAWCVTRAVATRSMIPRGGGLVVLLGFSPLRGIPGLAHACAGRAAVANLASGRPEEVGSVIAFLASAGGAYVTGATIVVDSGADAWGLGEPPPAPEREAP